MSFGLNYHLKGCYIAVSLLLKVGPSSRVIPVVHLNYANALHVRKLVGIELFGFRLMGFRCTSILL